MLIPRGEGDDEGKIPTLQAALPDLDHDLGAMLLLTLPWPWLRWLVPVVPVEELSLGTALAALWVRRLVQGQ
jgi:hypothetical protein